MNHRTIIVASLLYFPLAISPLYASPKDELEQTKQDIADSKAKQAELADAQKKVEKELFYLQQLLVKSAGTTQKSETDMADAADKVRILSSEMQHKDKDLAERKKNLEAMVQAALHLNAIPPEAVAIMPGKDQSQNAMRAASVLKMTAASLRKEMEEVEQETTELARLKKKAASRQQDLVASQEDLAKARAELKQRLEDRKSLKEKLGRRQEEEEKRLAELAKKAENLQSLVSSVSKGEKGGGGKFGRSLVAAKGKLRLPVAGRVVQGFGESKRDENSRGIVVEAGTDEAQVVAPFDGQVVFAGTFLGYGKLVILKHSDEFHTLLAGLDDIDARVGDFLLEGEPIGAMGNSEASHRLYVELRKDNQPINPEPWFKNLRKQ